MPPTTLIFLPAPNGNPSSLSSNTTASPTSTLITHISRTYAPKSSGSYSLDHRLMVDTSSLLPGHTAARRYTHFLNLSSRFPGKTFVGTSIAIPNPSAEPSGSINGSTIKATDSSGEFALITIPSQPDTLFPLLTQRMSPLWVPRQAHRVEGGASFLIDDWNVRIGELRILGGQSQGRVRGSLCEVEFLFGEDDQEEDHEEIHRLARAYFDSLVHGTGVDSSGMKVVEPVAGGEHGLVQQYMDLLKFARS